MATATETVRKCSCCDVSDTEQMLAYRDGALMCADCDSDAEYAWVAEDPENNTHYLDTFSPGGW